MQALSLHSLYNSVGAQHTVSLMKWADFSMIKQAISRSHVVPPGETNPRARTRTHARTHAASYWLKQASFGSITPAASSALMCLHKAKCDSLPNSFQVSVSYAAAGVTKTADR